VLSIEGVNAKTGSAAATSTAILAVDKDFTHKIVPGATKENDRYVLAIRHQITEESVSVNEVDFRAIIMSLG